MIVPVFGMHRSGTSALAGLLHNNGICMGEADDFYPPPMRENPKGFYENVRFRRINDAMLKACGYSVKSWSPVLPAVRVVPEELRTRMATLMQHYLWGHEHWGWKDPRSCLNAGAWLYTLERMGVLHLARPIFIFRDPKEVRASMLRRGNREREEGQFIRVHQMYYDALFESFKNYRGRVIHPLFVTFDQLIYNTQSTCRRLSTYLGVQVENNGHIDPQIPAKVA